MSRALSGLGLNPAVAPVAIAVAKNAYSWLCSVFGGNLVHGLQRDEFDARHANPHWFRALWYDGYWVQEGASEIPPGMSVQDYYVRRFDAYPWFPDAPRLLRNGVSLETLRLTSIPPGMQWPPGDFMDRVDRREIDRILPRSAAQAGLFESPWLLVGAAVAVFLLVSQKRKR